MESSQGTIYQIRETIASILRVGIGEVEDDVLIREELGIDSLRALEIISACERSLGVEIDESACADFKTVGEFVGHVTSLWHSLESTG